MSAEAWKFYIEYWDPYPTYTSVLYTGKILSFSGQAGRVSYMDQYNGGGFSLTIINDNDEAAQFVRGRYVSIRFADNQVFMGGRVVGIDFQDAPGTDQGVSLAVITCSDPVGQCGKANLNSFSFAQALTSTQATLPNGTFGTNIIPTVNATSSSSTASASTYSGSFLNKLNLLSNTEKGQIWPDGTKSLYFLNRKDVAQSSGYSLTRNGAAIYDIQYSGFDRIQLGDQFMNQVFVEPETVATQFGSNQSSIDTYGPAGYSISTLDYNTTQASGLASWLSTMQGDPNDYRYEVTTNDLVANDTNLKNWLLQLKLGKSLIELKWLKPGSGSDSVLNVVCEGFTVNAVPKLNTYTFYLSAVTTYQYFILNSSTFGILNTSRLGW
jgi:hypothetical protein